MSDQHRCQCCNKFLNSKTMVWLELDIRTNTYTNSYVPKKYSQGGFTFGKACAKKKKQEHRDKVMASDPLSAYKAYNFGPKI